VTLMMAGALMPLTVMVLEVTTVLSATSVCGVKLKGSGVVSAVTVVLVKVSLTPPMVSVVWVAVLKDAAEVWRTLKVCPLVMVLATVVQAPAPTWYSPPMTLIGAAALMPVTVRMLDVISVLKATLVWSAKLKGSGVVSVGAASVVAQNCPDTPPMVSVAHVCVLKLPEEVSRTATVLPLFTVPDTVVKAPPLTL
jgi:hypothetical protein